MSRLREILLKYEGVRLKPYKDTVGKLTIGCGRNLDDVGISQLEAMQMLTADMERAEMDAGHLDCLQSLNAVRQDVIISMVFNMGLEKVLGFTKMLSALKSGNYDIAAAEMLNSKWATQVGQRAIDLAKMIQTGAYS